MLLHYLAGLRGGNLAPVFAALAVEVFDSLAEDVLVGVLADLAVLVVRPEERFHGVGDLVQPLFWVRRGLGRL